MMWVAVTVLIGEILLGITLRRVNRSLGAYTQRLEAVHYQNIELRKNIAIMKSGEAINYILDNPTERKA